jgi:hypothetical protein
MALHDLFTHQTSSVVDVRPNSRGEFIQVWDAPFKAESRRLLLTYLRTPEGPTEICHRLELEDGRFAVVETCGTQRTYYYRENPHPPRVETILPSGRMLVRDPRNGFSVEGVFTTEFDWESLKPKGKPLGDRAVMKLQSEGQSWFLSTYQGIGEQLTLRVVERYRGKQREEMREVNVEG